MSTEDHNEPSFQEAARSGSKGLVGEFIGFMAENAKWWLIPFLVVFGLLAVVLVLATTGAAPFIYTMF